ncbi:MAG: hypothetical protein ABJP79_00660 [Tateyamaria sp.]
MAKIFNQTMNTSTTDADLFRETQQQIATDAAASGQSALNKNG